MIDNETFTPMSDLFVAQFTRPKHLEQINLRSLTPFQRALLVLDGTVTKFIEAYTYGTGGDRAPRTGNTQPLGGPPVACSSKGHKWHCPTGATLREV
jgi:hypothetical protein